MLPKTLEAMLLGVLTLVSLLWLEVLPPGWVAQAVMLLLGWSLLSTLLVGSAAAWVALARSRQMRGHRHR